MKKTFSIATACVIAALFTSCKKSYTCTCTDGTESSTVTLPRAKKKDAEAACNFAGTYLGTPTAVYTCKLN